MPRGKPLPDQDDWYRGLTPADSVCMNPSSDCAGCVFNSGYLARWCPPVERAAKSELDASRVEIAA